MVLEQPAWGERKEKREKRKEKDENLAINPDHICKGFILSFLLSLSRKWVHFQDIGCCLESNAAHLASRKTNGGVP